MKKGIEESYRKMYIGMIEKDRGILSEVLDESFVLVHMTGMRQSKDAFIRAVENGDLNYYSAEHQRMDVEVGTGTALLIGQSVVSAAVFGGRRCTWRLQLKIKLTQKGDDWKITEAVASTY